MLSRTYVKVSGYHNISMLMLSAAVNWSYAHLSMQLPSILLKSSLGLILFSDTSRLLCKAILPDWTFQAIQITLIIVEKLAKLYHQSPFILWESTEMISPEGRRISMYLCCCNFFFFCVRFYWLMTF